MITYLQLTNFRRHADLELRFDETAQLILIAGRNGVGKSTILEAITFAMYGESRHGRRNLQNLVRRGSDLEGMSVEMAFTVGDAEYRVHRRRDGKSSTAVLYLNDTPLAEGPVQVTEEITNIMGMDAAGFRLAVIAQQKDLDGLASLRPAERAQMVTRLLRLDALTSAKQIAAGLYRKERDIAIALRGPDVQSALDEAAAAEAAAETARGELARTQQALTLLDAELAATADVETLWQACANNIARIDGALAQLTGQLTSRESDLARTVVPDALDGGTFDVSELATQLSSVERELATAEATKRAAAQRHSVLDELARATARLETLQLLLAGDDPDVDGAQETVESLQMLTELKEAELTGLRRDTGRQDAVVSDLTAKLARSETLEATCDACGQDIPEAHRHEQVARFAADLDTAKAQLRDLVDRTSAATDELAALRQQVDAARGRHNDAKAALAGRVRAREEADEQQRRIGTYTAQLERLPEATVDIDALYARKGELTIAMTNAKAAADREKARVAALGRRDALRDDIAALTAQVQAKTVERHEAEPSADLQARYAERAAAADRRRDEEELANHWTTQVAVALERAEAARRRAGELEQAATRQAQHQQQAVYAAAAARLLGTTAERLSTEIRPSLEATVGVLLTAMSEGRFTKVEISPEYDIAVMDDGQFRPLSELSGGEVDLVALAVRLALSQVVSDRHGAGGAGFLILDECFGSQDPTRRSSILDALRSLRDTYSQIFLISHVENIEDSADVVVTVTASEDREETEVAVA